MQLTILKVGSYCYLLLRYEGTKVLGVFFIISEITHYITIRSDSLKIVQEKKKQI